MKVLHESFPKIIVLLLAVLAFLAYGSVNNRFYRVIAVEGNSMAPTLHYGDLIVITPPPEDIPISTIVLLNIDGSLVTHRLLGYYQSGYPITKGDANDVIDHFTNPNLAVLGVCYFRLPGFGYPLLFITHLLGRD